MTFTWRDWLILWAPLGLIGALAMVPVVDGTPTICPFALGTGVACPGCGMTRAASQLVRGDWSAAVAFHPVAPLLAVAVVAGWMWFLLVRLGRARPPSRGLVNGVLSAIAIALLAAWALRLLTGTLPVV